MTMLGFLPVRDYIERYKFEWCALSEMQLVLIFSSPIRVKQSPLQLQLQLDYFSNGQPTYQTFTH